MPDHDQAITSRFRRLEKTGSVKIVGIIYERNGRLCHAWPVSEEHREALESRNGECTCGSADYCDTINGYRVRCFSVGGDRCEWFSTNDVC
jgi:hypothetical protein